MNSKTLLVSVSLVAALLAGCSKEEPPKPQTTGQKIGQAIDDATAKASDLVDKGSKAAADAGDSIKKHANATWDTMKDKLDDLGKEADKADAATQEQCKKLQKEFSAKSADLRKEWDDLKD